MNSRDKISRSAMNMINVCKEMTISNVMTQISEGKLVVDKAQIPKLISVITQSIESSYLRVYPSFLKDVDECLTVVESKKSSKKN